MGTLSSVHPTIGPCKAQSFGLGTGYHDFWDMRPTGALAMLRRTQRFSPNPPTCLSASLIWPIWPAIAFLPVLPYLRPARFNGAGGSMISTRCACESLVSTPMPNRSQGTSIITFDEVPLYKSIVTILSREVHEDRPNVSSRCQCPSPKVWWVRTRGVLPHGRIGPPRS